MTTLADKLARMFPEWREMKWADLTIDEREALLAEAEKQLQEAD